MCRNPVSVANGCSGATLGLLGIVLGSLVLRFQESSDGSSHNLVFLYNPVTSGLASDQLQTNIRFYTFTCVPESNPAVTLALDPARADLRGALDRGAGADQRAVRRQDEDRHAAAKSVR